MEQESVKVFRGLGDPVAEQIWVEFAARLPHVVLGHSGGPDPLAKPDGARDVDFCRARAEAEARRAEEAAHPAARHAHLEMAALYHRRVLAARQIDDPAVQDWMR